MKATIPVTFEVESLEAPDELTSLEAQSAVEQAVWDYLSFVKISGYTSDSDEVEVHVDGHGPCKVRLAKE